MTKSDFIRLYDGFESFIKQEVNGEYCWNAICSFGENLDSYELLLHPSCLVWGSEMAFLSSLADRLYISMTFKPWRSEIRFF